MRRDATIEVWLGSDNIAEFVIVNDTPITDLSSLTRVLFCVDGLPADSDDLGSTVIWWTDSVTEKSLSDGTLFTGDVVRARLGQAELLKGDFEDCRLIIFSNEYPNGLVASDNIRVIVYPEC
jgi:hypothetical protein